MKKFMIVMTLVLAVFAPQLCSAGSDLSLKDKEYIRLMKQQHLLPDNLREEDVTPEQLNAIRTMIRKMEARHKAAREPGTKKPVPDNKKDRPRGGGAAGPRDIRGRSIDSCLRVVSRMLCSLMTGE